MLVGAAADRLEERGVLSRQELHRVVEGARDEQLPRLRERHDALRDVDAVADHVLLAVDVAADVHRAEVDAHAHRQLAGVIEHRERGEERALGVAEERDRRAVAGVDDHALARIDIGERRGEEVVEALLHLDLVGDAEARVAGDVEEQHAGDQRAAVVGGGFARAAAHGGVMLAVIASACPVVRP